MKGCAWKVFFSLLSNLRFCLPTLCYGPTPERLSTFCMLQFIHVPGNAASVDFSYWIWWHFERLGTIFNMCGTMYITY